MNLRTVSHRVLVGLLLLAGGLLAGCGDGDSSEGFDPVDGDELITSEAVAAVVVEHVGSDPDVSEAAEEDDGGEGGDGVGVSFRFGVDESSYDQGDLLRVGVDSYFEGMACDDEHYDGCEIEDVDGGQVMVAWQEEEPEEDPGIVVVTMARDDEVVGVYYAGDSIEGDPRDQDLSIEVSTMRDIVEDERLSLTTSEDAIELGEDVEWKPEEA